MTRSRDEWAKGVMSGEDHSLRATALRTITALAEPAYASVLSARNAFYNRSGGTSLNRPTVSVGNITTGGTGKTPVVRWLADHLRTQCLKPAVLLRGYKAGASSAGDEQQVLSRALGDGVVVEAGPSRIESAARVLTRDPDVGVFLLDDAFQHRKVARDFDLVLVNAADPFGFGRVLPRGLLREPLSGLRRADAILLTRSDQVPAAKLTEIESTLRRHNPNAPIYHSTHTHVGLRSDTDVRPMDQLMSGHFFAFAGIGNPDSLGDQLRRHAPAGFKGHRWFGDHHDYSGDDLRQLQSAASQAGATFLVTTEKDWVKVARLSGLSAGLPIYRLDLQVQFPGDDGDRLLRQILDAIRR